MHNLTSKYTSPRQSDQNTSTSTMTQSDGYNLYSQTGEMKHDVSNSLVADQSALIWKELEDLESQRREILKRVELPFWRILTHWAGTCLKPLVLDRLIWLTLAIFFVLRIVARSLDDMPEIAERLGDADIDILGGFLSFLLVLFVNQTNARFFDMYKLAKACSGQIQDVAGLVSTQLPPAAAHRVVRYMNAALVAGFVGLGGPYSKQHFFCHFNDKHTLLTANEMACVEDPGMDSGSATFKELVTWCQKDIGRAQKAGDIGSYEAAQLHSRILAFRAAMDGIYDFSDQPPFFYYIHFLCLLSALYLPLFAVDNACSSGWGDEAHWSLELLNGTIVLVQCFFVVGLRLLAQKMLDPFGDDLEDLSVATYVSTTIENSRVIMTTTQHQPDVDDALEEQLAKQNEPGWHIAV